MVKTTLYAIVDFFENRNFNKCIKYIERVKSVKIAYDDYAQMVDPKKELIFILEKYKNKIKRKYKFINDYPFITSYFLSSVTDKHQVKCIYRNLRVSNRKMLKDQINKYDNECKKIKNYQTDDSKNTLVDTDEEAKNI